MPLGRIAENGSGARLNAKQYREWFSKVKNYDRILKLVSACACIESRESLTLYPDAKEFGGEPFPNLASELNALLHGIEPAAKCKEVK